MASTAVLIHALFIDPVTWGLMRFVTGLCMAGLYVTEESWLNDLARRDPWTASSRCMIVTMGGMTIGRSARCRRPRRREALSSCVGSRLGLTDPGRALGFEQPPLVVPSACRCANWPASSRPASSPQPSAARGRDPHRARRRVRHRGRRSRPGSPPSSARRCSARCCCSGRSVGSRSGVASRRDPRRAGIAVATCVAGGVTEALDCRRPDGGARGGVVPDLLADDRPHRRLATNGQAHIWLGGARAGERCRCARRPLVATVVIGSTSPIAYFWSMAAINLIIAAYSLGGSSSPTLPNIPGRSSPSRLGHPPGVALVAVGASIDDE